MSEFSLGRLVYRAVKETSLVDPSEVAQAIFDQIDESDHDAALLQALRTIARIEMASQREIVALPDLQGTPKAGRSRAAAVREWWSGLLAEPERNAAGKWVALGDFTAADLLAAADLRLKLARENEVKALQYKAFADLMAKHDVKRLRDVPRRELATAAGQVAA